MTIMRHALTAGVLFGALFSYLPAMTEAQVAQPANTETVPKAVEMLRFAPPRRASKDYHGRLNVNATTDSALMENLGLFDPNPGPFSFKFLKEEIVLNEGESPKLLIFTKSGLQGWPGSQPITLVVVDKDHKPLSWLQSGGEPIFLSASLYTGGEYPVLEVKYWTRRKSQKPIERFRIKDNTIEKIGVAD